MDYVHCKISIPALDVHEFIQNTRLITTTNRLDHTSQDLLLNFGQGDITLCEGDIKPLMVNNIRFRSVQTVPPRPNNLTTCIINTPLKHFHYTKYMCSTSFLRLPFLQYLPHNCKPGYYNLYWKSKTHLSNTKHKLSSQTPTLCKLSIVWCH